MTPFSHIIIIIWHNLWSCEITWHTSMFGYWLYKVTCPCKLNHVICRTAEIMWITCDHVGSHVIKWDHMWSCESHAIMWITCDHVGSHVIMMMWDHMWSWSCGNYVIMWDHMYLHVGSCDHMLWVIQSLIQSHKSTIMWDHMITWAHMWHALLTCDHVRSHVKTSLVPRPHPAFHHLHAVWKSRESLAYILTQADVIRKWWTLSEWTDCVSCTIVEYTPNPRCERQSPATLDLFAVLGPTSKMSNSTCC